MTRARTSQLLCASLAVWTICACETKESTPPKPVEASPNATLTPAPLLSGKSLLPAPENSATKPNPAASSKLNGAVASQSLSEQLSGVPIAMPMLSALPPDYPQDRFGSALGLRATFGWEGENSNLRFEALSQAENLAIAERLRPKLAIELRAIGRMFIELDSDAFSLPQGTRLLARFDRLGHLLVWPNRRSYRGLPRSSMRALLSEGRVDVTPALGAERVKESDTTRLGATARRRLYESARGSLILEQVQVEGSGLGGPLLCRWLFEIAALRPSNAACDTDWVPAWANVRGTEGESLVFTVTELERRDETFDRIYVPPRSAEFKKRELPERSVSLLSGAEIGALRNGDPSSAFTASNNSSIGTYLVLNGARIAFLPPHSEAKLGPFVAGSYAFSYRGFFGERRGDASPLELPASTRVRTALDGGAVP